METFKISSKITQNKQHFNTKIRKDEKSLSDYKFDIYQFCWFWSLMFTLQLPMLQFPTWLLHLDLWIYAKLKFSMTTLYTELYFWFISVIMIHVISQHREISIRYVDMILTGKGSSNMWFTWLKSILSFRFWVNSLPRIAITMVKSVIVVLWRDVSLLLWSSSMNIYKWWLASS